MLELLEYISKLFLVLAGVYSIHKLWGTVLKPSLLAPVLAVFLVFFWLPPLLDFFLGKPEYGSKFYKFQLATRDPITGLIYNVYVSFILFLFNRRIAKPKYRIISSELFNLLINLNKRSFYLYLICFIPVILLIFVEDPGMYLIYRALNPDYEIPEGDLDRLLINSTMLAGICSPILFFLKSKISTSRYKGLESVLILFLMFAAVFLNGKRFIIPIIFICYGGLYYYSGISNKTKLLRLLLLVISLFFAFVVFYGKNLSGDFNEVYTRLRIDFGRDDVTKFTIYEVIVNRRAILEYPFQSFLFNILFYLPRGVWPEKPFPYAVYLTSNLLGYKDIRLLGWTMTTSIFEECIANLRYLGFLFPYFYFYLIRKVSELKLIPKFIGMLFLLMLIVVQFSAMSYLFVLFLMAVLTVKERRKLNSVSGIQVEKR